MLSVKRANAKDGSILRGKRALNPAAYDKLFAVYLTPKAFKELKSKGDNFSKVLSEARKV